MLRTTPLLMHLFFACAPLLAEKKLPTTYYTSSYLTIERPAPINFKRVAVAYLTVSVFLPFILFNGGKYLLEPITFGMNQLILLLYFSLSGALYSLPLYGLTYIKRSNQLLFLTANFILTVCISRLTVNPLHKFLDEPLEHKSSIDRMNSAQKDLNNNPNDTALKHKLYKHYLFFVIRLIIPYLQIIVAWYAYGFNK